MRRRAAFTLVELLVVIGIIAILVGILLPTYVSMRHKGKTLGCLSNLRQLGAAHTKYVLDYDGYLIPSDWGDLQPPGPNGYGTTDSWATILVAKGYVPYPMLTVSTPGLKPPSESTLLRCPEGEEDTAGETSIISQQPKSRTDGMGAWGIRYTSKVMQKDRVVYAWYGINGASGDQNYIPCKRWPRDGGSLANPGRLHRISQLKKPAQLVFLFDGFAIHVQSVNANRLNARHNNRTATNILFFDGHVETFPTAGLPGGLGNAGNTSATASATFSWNTTGTGNLNKPQYSHPLWRMDQ